MRSSSQVLLSRIGHQHQPYSPFVRHSANRIGPQHQPYSPFVRHSAANFTRFYTSKNTSEEPSSGVWNVLKKCSSWIKNKLEGGVWVTVPEGKACVIQRHGAYVNTLKSGIHSLGSLDKVAYVYSLEEETISLPKQSVVTSDNVPISVDGSMGVKIVDPTLSPYALEKPMHTVMMLTQTIVCAQIGKVTLDETFENRDTLNERILMKINDDLKDWGLECVHYEIRDITVPTRVKEAADALAETKLKVRASMLETEAETQKIIKTAEEKKMATIRAAQEESEAIVRKAHAEAEKISEMAKGLRTGEKTGEVELAKIFARVIGGENVVPEETSKKR